MDDAKDSQPNQKDDERVERRWAWISIVGWLVFLVASAFVLERHRDWAFPMVAVWAITGMLFFVIPAVYLMQGPRSPEETMSTEQRTLQQLELLTEEVRRIADAFDRLEERTGGPSERS
jgi:hypothetical protein